MESYRHKAGVTLVEILVVVGIIAALASMVIGLATHIDNQGKERLAKATIATLTAALEQFRDFDYHYRPRPNPAYNDQVQDREIMFIFSLDFPPDCNNFAASDIEKTLPDVLAGTNVVIAGGSHDSSYSAIEVAYLFLNKVPTSRKTLDKIDSLLVTNMNANGDSLIITIDGENFPLMRVIDPWGTALRYDYYMDWKDYQVIYGNTLEDYFNYIKDNKKTFPVIKSAGSDRLFGTVDDITSR